MNTAIIVATHGAAAGPLINTTQMIVGQQENIATIDFLPGKTLIRWSLSLKTFSRRWINEMALSFWLIFTPVALSMRPACYR